MNTNYLIKELNNLDNCNLVIIDNTNLVSILTNILIDINLENSDLITFVDIYSKLGEYEKSDIFPLLNNCSIEQLYLFKEVAEFIVNNNDLGVSDEFDLFLKEIDFFITKWKVFIEVENNNSLPMNLEDILSYKDDFYDYSVNILASKKLSRISDEDLSLMLESLEWVGFTANAKLNLMPRVILYGLDCFCFSKKMDYIFDYFINILKAGILTDNSYNLLVCFINQIDNFKDDLDCHDINDIIKIKELLNND